MLSKLAVLGVFFLLASVFSASDSSLIPTAVFAAENEPSTYAIFPGEYSKGTDYRNYIQAFYRFSIGGSILVATVMIMIGGVIWITSAGDKSRIGKAREYIINSIIGVVLLMGAYVILAVINPNLVELKIPAMEKFAAPGSCTTKSPMPVRRNN